MQSLTPVRTPRDRLDRLLAIGKRMLRFWWLGALVVVLVTGAVIGVATVKPKLYLSETVLLYQEGIRASTLLGREADTEATRKVGLRLKELVMARPRLQEIIDTYKLYPAIVAEHGYVEAVDEMRKALVFKVREGDTFLLSFSANDPALARDVTAALAKSLVDENSKYRTDQAEVTRKFIFDEKERKAKDLSERETALAAFLARHPEFAQDATAAQGGAAVRAAEKNRRTSGGDSEVLALEREAGRIRQRLEMPSAPRATKAPERDPRLVEARNDAERALQSAQRNLADKQANLTDQHPDVVQAKSAVRAAEERLRKAEDALARGELIMPEAPPATESERPALEARLKKVEAEIADVRRRKAANAGAAAEKQSNVAAEIVELETEWSRLNREVAEARERYQALEGKEFVAQMQASSEETGQAAQMVIVDPAYKPTKPTGGGRAKMAIIGFAAGIALALALVLALAIFDDRLYDKVDAEALELAPVLSVIPRGDKRGWRQARG